MPQRIATKTVTLQRDGKTIRVLPDGKPFNFTAQEIEDLRPFDALRIPVDESVHDPVAAALAARAAASGGSASTATENSDSDAGNAAGDGEETDEERENREAQEAAEAEAQLALKAAVKGYLSTLGEGQEATAKGANAAITAAGIKLQKPLKLDQLNALIEEIKADDEL